MRYRTTAFLLIVAAGLFAWIYFGELRQHEVEETAEMFPGFSAESIKEISIASSNQTVRLVRDMRTRWRLVEPLVYPADQVVVDQLLSTIPVLPANRVDTGNITWQVLEAFGLNPPSVQVTLSGEGGASHVLSIGNTTPKGNRSYFSVDAAPGVYVVPGAFASYVSSPVDFWRDRTFVELEFDEMTTLKVARDSQGFSLSRSGEDGLWKLLPLDVPADGLTIELLLSAFGHAQVNAFVPPSEVDLVAMGLNAPPLSLEFLRSTNRILKVDFGISPEDSPEFVYARHSAGTNVFLVSSELAGAFRRPAVDFRERQLLSFEPDKVGRIEFSGSGAVPFHVAKTEDGNWKLGGAVDTPADTELVSDLLDQLTALRIRTFDKDVVADFASYDLASPSRRINLRGDTSGADAPLLASLSIGTNNASAVGLVHVRANEGKSVASIDLAAVTELPRAPYSLRDRSIWSFETNAVVSVHVKDREAEWKVVRRGANDWEVAPPYGGFANPFEVEAGVAQLSDLRAVRWRSDDPRYSNIYGFPERNFEVTINTLSGGEEQSYKIAFGTPWSPDENRYAMVELDGVPVFFEFSGQIYQLVEKYLTVPQPAPKPDVPEPARVE